MRWAERPRTTPTATADLSAAEDGISGWPRLAAVAPRLAHAGLRRISLALSLRSRALRSPDPVPSHRFLLHPGRGTLPHVQRCPVTWTTAAVPKRWAWDGCSGSAFGCAGLS